MINRSLKQLPVDKVFQNPENPRLIFRQEEMESLMLSIDQHGIQVPVTVYRDDDGKYRLLDGERRWRCARKLNLKTIPALIQEKPSELENLVIMYNIHALREQWDYFTTATKLERVRNLYEAEHDELPTEVELSRLTGLTRGAIRRCQLLIDLPDEFKDRLSEELEKPKSRQRLSEDFFIEMERSLKTVINRIPEYAERLPKLRQVLIEKFERGTIKAVTDFRQLSKIATAIDGLGIAQAQAKKALEKVFTANNGASIADAYDDAVKFEYVERKMGLNARHLIEFLEGLDGDDDSEELTEEFVQSLQALYNAIGELLADEARN